MKKVRIIPCLLFVGLLFTGCKVTTPLVPETFLKQDERIPTLIQGGNWKKDSMEFLPVETLTSDDFQKQDWSQNWILEGPGQVQTGQGKLEMSSVLAPSFIKAYERAEFNWVQGAMQPYFQSLEKVAQAELGTGAEQYYEKGKFKGGHIVLWNKQKTPDNYVVEFDLQHHSPMGLFILFFSADGLNGKDLFSKELKPRNGIFNQYVRGDNQSYHISTYTPHRGTANLRRNPGAHRLKTTKDLASMTPSSSFKYRLIKWGNRFQYYLGDQLQMDYTDTSESPLGSGYAGLRLMAGARISVEKFRIHKLITNPFAKAQMQESLVANSKELISAIESVRPGQRIYLKAGKYADVKFDLAVKASAKKPIEIKAEKAGSVVFSGKPALKISGDWITLSGIKFQDGDRKNNTVSVKRKGNHIEDPVAPLITVTGSFNRISHCSIDNFDGTHGLWGELNGFSNRIDHCSFTNKMTHGNFWNIGTQKEGAYHRIDHNSFSRPKIMSDSASSLRLGSGYVADHSAKIIIEHNVFLACDGEGEVISDKCSDNIHRYNKYLNCNGVLSLRQGKRTHIYGNSFIRDDAFKITEGIRPFGIGIREGGHLIENNYFQGLGTAINFAAGQPEGYLKPGRSPELGRHHIAAYDTKIFKNNFFGERAMINIEEKMPENYNRVILPKNIQLKSNLFTTATQQLTRGDDAGFEFKDNYVLKPKTSSEGESPPIKVQDLPFSLLQRYGSLTGKPIVIVND